MSTNTVQQSHLKLFTKGLPQYEQRIIEATAKISHSRPLALHLVVEEGEAETAEVIVIDGTNTDAVTWAKGNRVWLQDKVVIWIDAQAKAPRHVTLKRPVLWVNLPIIISRIYDDIDTKKAAGNIAAEMAESTPADKTTSPSTPEKAHILVCDDSQAVRAHLSSLLSEQGYSTTVVESGESAVEAVQNQRFDCVLMDVLMPGMDGYRACREILRRGLGLRDTPVIMLTSKTSPFDKIRGKMSGCSAYLTKPVTVRELLQTLERHAKRKQI